MKIARAKFAARAKKEFETHAKENVEIEMIGNAIYAFGSELATLRLYNVYSHADFARAGYSKNRGSFYFTYELSLIEFED